MLLSLLIFLPVLFALIVAMLPEKVIRPASLLMSLLHFALSLVLFYRFNPSSAGLQLIEKTPWLPTFGVNYFVGIDGISFWLVILSTFLTPLVVLGSWTAITEKIRSFHICLFLLSSAMIGTFLALDAILFYAFFEASLIPMYFMVGVWGGARRLYATMKFFIYTMAGSLFMLVAIIALIFMTQEQLGTMSASIPDFYKLQIPFVAGDLLNTQTILFFAFALAFAIKVPMFPVHTWLPDAHVEAPTPGSVILAAVMLKMGTYGFLRFVLPIFPLAAEYWAWLFMLLGVIGIIYGALVAMVQPDIKKLVAYSSVSHMGYVMLGIFALNIYGVTGGLYQMLNHGISTGALFLLVGMLYERTHSRQIADYGGLAKVAPIYTIAFIIVTFSSIAVPLTNGFIGEFLILLGGFEANKIFGGFAVLGVILGAVYMLWAVKRIFFGAPGKLVGGGGDTGHGGHGVHAGHGHGHAAHGSHDDHSGLDLEIGAREMFVLAPLVILIFWMGLFPSDFLNWSKASLDHLVQNRTNYQLNVEE
ncbi:MAG: NADH-quinone oxidoreductase subunit M [Bdellovibrionales bacterium]|nr:NADH-quinone oxidoreductase subunit M [Bdellovibrionales bacterium]